MRRLVFLGVITICTSCCASTTETFATNVDGSGTNLSWDRYTPSSGGPTWPTVITVNGGGYNSGTRGPGFVAQDLANAGFLVFAPDHRLAPPHTASTFQVDPPSDGRPTEQTDDVRTALRAARADSHCNGLVGIAGFSGGGSHGAWWAIAGTAGDDKPDALVSLSGVYDNDNSDLLADSHLRGLVENYINHTTDEGATFTTAAKAASAYWLTVSSTPAPFMPFHSTGENLPLTIYSTMVTKMTNAGGTVEGHQRSGSQHGSDYWYLSCGSGCAFSSVKDCAIDFFQRMLVTSAYTPTGPASITVKKK